MTACKLCGKRLHFGGTQFCSGACRVRYQAGDRKDERSLPAIVYVVGIVVVTLGGVLMYNCALGLPWP